MKTDVAALDATTVETAAAAGGEVVLLTLLHIEEHKQHNISTFSYQQITEILLAETVTKNLSWNKTYVSSHVIL